jgi:hypothetical protein
VDRPHTIFAVNLEVAECADCRRRFNLPWRVDVYGNRDPNHSLEDRLALLTPEYKEDRYSKPVGYCSVPLFTYFNPTEHELNLSPLGVGKIPPHSFFTLGNATKPDAVKSHAPQLIYMPGVSKSSRALGLSLLPYTTNELVTSIGSDELRRYRGKLDFGNAQSRR